MNTRFQPRQIVVLVFALIILLPILFTAAPGAVKAQESPEFTGSPAKLSPKQQLLYVMARSPIFAKLIEDEGLLDRASDVAPALVQSSQGVAPEAPSANQIEYWRYVYATCYVKISSFAGLQVDWKHSLASSYLGDCVFSISYEASGTTAMGDGVISDTWKKGMNFGLDQSYVKYEFPFDLHSNCGPGSWSYDSNTGAVVTHMHTPAAAWQCGYTIDVFTKNGLDMSVFSPKPRVSATVIDVSTGKTVKPEAMITDGTHGYTLQVEMKSFAIKSPALTKQSGFHFVDTELFASRFHAVSDTGMYLENFDPYWASISSGAPPGQTDAYVDWIYQNNVYGGVAPPESGVALVPSTSKAIFPPSLMTVSQFTKSGVIVAPNIYDPTTNTGYLYGASVEVSYMHKGISFITGDDIHFSGNPADIAPIRYNYGVVWNLQLWAAYPDYTINIAF